MRFVSTLAGFPPGSLPSFCFLALTDTVLKSCTKQTFNAALLPLLYFLLNLGQCYNFILKLLLPLYTFHKEITYLMICSFKFFQLIFILKAVMGVAVLIKYPWVTLTSWHLFCDLWWFIVCISEKIALSQLYCAIKFFIFQPLELGKIGTRMQTKRVVMKSKSPSSVKGGNGFLEVWS